MTNKIEYNSQLNKFSYQSKEVYLLNELDELKDLRQRVNSYNEKQNYRYMLRLLTAVKRPW